MKYRLLGFLIGKEKALTLSYDNGSEEDIRFLNTINII